MIVICIDLQLSSDWPGQINGVGKREKEATTRGGQDKLPLYVNREEGQLLELSGKVCRCFSRRKESLGGRRDSSLKCKVNRTDVLDPSNESVSQRAEREQFRPTQSTGARRAGGWGEGWKAEIGGNSFLAFYSRELKKFFTASQSLKDLPLRLVALRHHFFEGPSFLGLLYPNWTVCAGVVGVTPSAKSYFFPVDFALTLSWHI